MKIVIFGASGRTGSLLINAALIEGYKVVAYVRQKKSIIKVHPNLEVIVGQLDDKRQLKKAIKGAKVCFSALGGKSLTKHTPELITGIDNIVNIMEQEKVLQFIYLSSLGAGESQFLIPHQIRYIITKVMLRMPLAVHNINEERIANSKLKWTIIRPGGFNNKEQTDNLRHGCDIIAIKGGANISRANVAAFMLQQLKNNEYENKAVWLLEK